MAFIFCRVQMADLGTEHSHRAGARCQEGQAGGEDLGCPGSSMAPVSLALEAAPRSSWTSSTAALPAQVPLPSAAPAALSSPWPHPGSILPNPSRLLQREHPAPAQVGKTEGQRAGGMQKHSERVFQMTTLTFLKYTNQDIQMNLKFMGL
ncbi:hypothetical protein NN561_019414 [Cricetulus griseus]